MAYVGDAMAGVATRLRADADGFHDSTGNIVFQIEADDPGYHGSDLSFYWYTHAPECTLVDHVTGRSLGHRPVRGRLLAIEGNVLKLAGFHTWHFSLAENSLEEHFGTDLLGEIASYDWRPFPQVRVECKQMVEGSGSFGPGVYDVPVTLLVGNKNYRLQEGIRHSFITEEQTKAREHVVNWRERESREGETDAS